MRWAPNAGEEGSGRLLAPGARRAPCPGSCLCPSCPAGPLVPPLGGGSPDPIPLPVNPASAPAAEPGFLHRQGLLDFSLLCCEITIN